MQITNFKNLDYKKIKIDLLDKQQNWLNFKSKNSKVGWRTRKIYIIYFTNDVWFLLKLSGQYYIPDKKTIINKISHRCTFWRINFKV